jgi:predicted RecA/RadA family phage recombinase
MADITVTAARVGLPFPTKAVVRTYVAGVAITKGQAVYLTTAGLAGVADANASGKEQFRGIALNTAGVGQAVDVLHEGEVAGFTVSGMNVGAFAYLSDTAGALADAAGTMTVRVGRVTALSDKDATKVLRIFTSWDADWA